MKFLLALVVLIPFLVNESFAFKVAMLANFGRSHLLVLEKLGEELRRRGHEIVIIVGSEADYGIGKPHVKMVKMNKESESIFHPDHDLPHLNRLRDIIPSIIVKQLITHVTRVQAQKITCDLTLSQKEITRELKQADIIVGDAMYLCSSLVAEWLDLPHIVVSMSFLDTPLNHLFGFSTYPNYVPALMSRLPAEMTLLGRVQNVMFSLLSKLLASVYVGEGAFGPIKAKYNIRPEKSTMEVLANVDLYLLTKAFILDHAQPIPPYVRVVGNFMVTPARPLPSEFEEFMQRFGDEGVIVASFGTMAEAIDEHVLQKMTEAFSRLPQGVIWKLDPDDVTDTIPPNIKAVKWLPQNDLLGHNNTRLFFTHGGANGLEEATYHGIPMVCSPLGADQFDNAQIIVHAGIGEMLEVKYATVDQIVQAINRVLTEKRYKENSVRVSRVQRMRQRLPVEEAADLVEYAQAVGHLDHLKPRGQSLPFYKLYMLDVLAVLVVALGVIIGLIVAICKFIVGSFRDSRKKKTS